MKNLNGALDGFLKPGEVIKLTTDVDPALIGGMTVRSVGLTKDILKGYSQN
jgi:F0F1-type ATP synthase delta subunit